MRDGVVLIVERLVAATAARDGHEVTIGIEQEPGAAGLALVERYTRHPLRGYRVFAERVTGRKLIRTQPVAAAAENGLVKLVRGRQSEELLDELTARRHVDQRERLVHVVLAEAVAAC